MSPNGLGVTAPCPSGWFASFQFNIEMLNFFSVNSEVFRILSGALENDLSQTPNFKAALQLLVRDL